MNRKQYRALLDLVMCCDPWPVSTDGGENEMAVKDMLNQEAQARGFPDWVDAYHNLQERRLTYTADQSKNIREVLYNDDSTMDVTYQNGKKYRYFDVPVAVFDRAETSESIGGFLATDVKGNYRYACVNGD